MTNNERPLTPKSGTLDVVDQPISPLKIVSLVELSASYVFFTPALLLQAGDLDRDPVAQASDILRLDREISVYNSPTPLFSGLGWTALATESSPVSWDHRVYCVHTERWPELRDLLAGMAWVHPKHGVVRVVVSSVQLVEHYRGAPRTVPVYAFQPLIGEYAYLLYDGDIVGRPRAVKVPRSQLNVHSLHVGLSVEFPDPLL